MPALAAVKSLIFDPCPIMRYTYEKQNLGTLGSLRGALSIYHDEKKGYPLGPSELVIGGRYLEKVPLSATCSHRRSAEIQLLSAGEYSAGRFNDSGGWAYVTSGPSSGTILVNCTHTDVNGRVWAQY